MGSNKILPEDKVLFIGGHEKLVSKLKTLYPKWVYLSQKERNCGKVKGDFRFVVAKYDSLSHNIMERAYAFVGNDIPTIYATGTNVNRVICEIEEGYRKLQLNKAS